MRVKSKSGGSIAILFATTQADNPQAIIVLGHPMGKEAKGYFIKNGYADLLLGNGYHVLLFDFNGFGESTNGSFSYFDDIIAVGNKARTLAPGLPVGYHGISMGGQWATIAFADSGHYFDFAIIESATTTLDEFWVHFSLAHKALKVLNVLMPRFRAKINFGERIRTVCRLRSILFIYSESDAWATPAMGERFHKNCGVPSTLWRIPEAGHAAIMKSAYSEAYGQKILEYFHQSVRSLAENRFVR